VIIVGSISFLSSHRELLSRAPLAILPRGVAVWWLIRKFYGPAVQMIWRGVARVKIPDYDLIGICILQHGRYYNFDLPLLLPMNVY
jgi:hypothetical protein